ncbi:hypothetical protein COV49_01420, partial [Candidatus Falkowbacteria bacterium CG11_big_fil_rev_8_21_14_0_20_39_10]
MQNHKFKIYIFLTFLLFFTTACSVSFKSGETGNDGGVYASANQGKLWKQMALIPTVTGSAKSIASLDNYSLAMDPSDDEAIYFGSLDNGLFYSYDRAKEWRVAEGLERKTVTAVAVDPDAKCIIYAAMENKIYKSTDCNRAWEQAYFDNNVETKIYSIAIDYYDSRNVYIATSRGEVIKSPDRGTSWQTVGRFDDEVKKIVISPNDSRVLFVGTDKKSVWRSLDGGVNWVSLEENLKTFKDSKKFRDLAMSQAEPGVIFLATDYGLLKSSDQGNTWSQIELITPEKKAVINSIAVSPKNAKEIYYVTNTTFYSSENG